MGRQYIQGNWDNPQVIERENFKQVLICDRLRPILFTQIASIVKHLALLPVRFRYAI
jgi:hypothetical protein